MPVLLHFGRSCTLLTFISSEAAGTGSSALGNPLCFHPTSDELSMEGLEGESMV
jgi:hypothetical protein